ncbi:MAG: CAP domain-containing protein [Defluviitaleaceae bacterium]|nr:CAP domain-containing protein [Defluviitaleaceae bacterium]
MKIRKMLVAVAVTALTTIICALTVYAGGISVLIEDRYVNFEGQAPIAVGDSILVPVHEVFEKLGFAVSYHRASRRITLQNGNHIIIIAMDDDRFTRNGESFTLGVPARLVGGTPMLPLGEIVHTMGYITLWNGETNTLSVHNGAINQTVTPQQMTASPQTFSTAHLSDAARELMNLTNTHRIANGLPALAWHGGLEQAAQRHVEDTARARVAQNVGSDGSTHASRIADTGYNMVYPGGNTLMAGTRIISDAFGRITGNSTLESNLLSPSVTHTAFAYIIQGNQTYLVQKFGTPAISDEVRFAREMHQVVNGHRAAEGLPPLAWDVNLAHIALLRVENDRVVNLTDSLVIERANPFYGNVLSPGTVINTLMGTATAHQQIMNPDATHLGIGYRLTFADGQQVPEFSMIFAAEDETTLLAQPHFAPLLVDKGRLQQPTHTPPNRRLTGYEMDEWVAEYRQMGGANAFEIEVMRLVNQERTRRGLVPVELDPALMMAARFYADQKVTFGDGIGHNVGPYAVNPDNHRGASVQVATTFGGILRWDGGNSARGGRTPEEVVGFWMESHSHMQFLLGRDHRFIGVGMRSTNNGYDNSVYMFMADIQSRQ